MRLIDADALKQVFNQQRKYALEKITWTIDRAIENIDDAKTIEIIHCKDCKYFRQSDMVGDHCYNDDFYPKVVHECEPDDFCSFACKKGN